MKHYAKLTAVKGDGILLPENHEYVEDALDRRLIHDVFKPILEKTDSNKVYCISDVTESTEDLPCFDCVDITKSVDVVELVRCEDCKFLRTNFFDGWSEYTCILHHNPKSPKWFCPDGVEVGTDERKESDIHGKEVHH